MRKSRKKKAKSISGLSAGSGISAWFALQTLIIVGVGVSTTLVINKITRTFAGIEDYNTIRVTLIIITLVILLIIFEILQYRIIKRHLEKICIAISRLSHGEYGHKLKINRHTIFKGLSSDINLLSEELQNVHMMRNDFVNSYSHEFKTPIASINGFAQLLLDDETLPPETQKQYLRIIVDESERLTSLASNTILLSQLDTQKIVANKKPYSLDEQLRRCTITLYNLWREKRLNIQGDIEEILFNGDEDMMTQVWLNLLNNAIKFTPEGGTITVTATQKSRKIVVKIEDTGCGMSQETIDNIFKKYYQANADIDKTKKGLGLGLPIVERTVTLHGGKITVESQLGKGSVFTVELPQQS